MLTNYAADLCSFAKKKCLILSRIFGLVICVKFLHVKGALGMTRRFRIGPNASKSSSTNPVQEIYLFYTMRKGKKRHWPRFFHLEFWDALV